MPTLEVHQTQLFYTSKGTGMPCLVMHGGLGLDHTYGGFIALEYALRYPDSVSHLILVDTAPVFNYGEDIMHNAVNKGATPEMLEALTASSSTDEAMKSTLKRIFPLYFYRYQPAYDAFWLI